MSRENTHLLASTLIVYYTACGLPDHVTIPYTGRRTYHNSKCRETFCMFFTLQEFHYKTVEILDLPEMQICHHFQEMFDFITDGLKYGSVLVHW